MSPSALMDTAGLPAAPAVLLVLLPSATDTAGPDLSATLAGLRQLQHALGAAIRILHVGKDTHPAVVRSFDGRDLPAFVLVHHGAELWRQQGLPNTDGIAALLLGKLKETYDPLSAR